MAGKRNRNREAGGMFEEFEPAPSKPVAETAPLFELPAAAPVSVPKDYGQAVAPVREVKPTPMFDAGSLTLPDDDAEVLAIGFTY